MRKRGRTESCAGLDGPVVLLSPGAGWGAKRWPAERYGAVAAALHAQGYMCPGRAGPLLSLRSARRPTLRSPARTGAERDHGPSSPSQYFVRPRLRLGVTWQGGKDGRKWLSSSRGANFHGLLDYVQSLGCNPLAKKPACGPLARLVFSDHPRGAG